MKLPIVGGSAQGRWLLSLLGVLLGYLLMRSLALSFQRYRLERLFVDTARVMQDCQVDHWFDFGTLLGLHRDGHPVCPSDTDVDVQMASWEDRQRLIDCGAPKFRALNLELDLHRNDFGGLMLRDPYGYYADLDTWGTDPEDPELLRCLTLPYCQPEFLETDSHAQFCRIRRQILLPTQVSQWQGQPARVPHRVEDLLVLRYGDGWRVPRKFDKGTDTTPWDTFKARISPVIEAWFVLRTWLVLIWVTVATHWLFLGCLSAVLGFLYFQQVQRGAPRSRVFRNLTKGMQRLTRQGAGPVGKGMSMV